MINVVVCFSNLCMSQGLCRLLASDENIQVHAVSEQPQLIRGLRGIRPDVLLVDFLVLNNYLPMLPEEVKVVLLDTECGEDNIFYALIAKNISGVIRNDADVSELGKAIESVVSGDLWLDRAITKNLLSRLSRLAEFWRLTEQEADMLHLISKGMDNVMMAEILGIDVNTIPCHLDRLKQKMKAKDRWDMLMLSMQFDKYDMPRT